MREVEEELIREPSVDSYSISSINGKDKPECLLVADDFETGTLYPWASPTLSIRDRIDSDFTPDLNLPETFTSLVPDENWQFSSELFSVGAGLTSLTPGLIVEEDSYTFPFETSTSERDTNMLHAYDCSNLNINPTFPAFSAPPEMSSSVSQHPPISSMLPYGDLSAYPDGSTPESTCTGAFRRSSF